MKKSCVVTLLLLVVSVVSGCSEQVIHQDDVSIATGSALSAESKVIYTSFYPIYFLTKSLVGDQAMVINLVPAGGEPHEFEPSLKQIGNMGQADMIVLNGLGMEHYESKIVEKFGTGKVYLLSENLTNLIKLDEKVHAEHEHEENHEDHEGHGHDHGDTDPHTWLSPKVYNEMAHVLAKELESRGYKINTGIFLELKTLDEKYMSGLAYCTVKELVTSHEAFGYFVRDYKLEQHAVLGISPEEEPSAKDIKDVVDMIKQEKLQYIFSEPFVSQKFSDTIKKETGAEVFLLHPLETLSSEEEQAGENYISVMTKNLEKIIIGLQCK